ncbi:MAG: hypothetical protein R6X16_07865 [Anaerolineae bacterium]
MQESAVVSPLAAVDRANLTPGLFPLIAMLGDPLGPRLLATLAGAPAELDCEGLPDDLEIIDRELARLFAARELYLAWVEEVREQGGAGISPAQFLRAWSESTGRVIQLLRARRDLGRGAGADALLDAVYQELERRLPEFGGERGASDPADAGSETSSTTREEEAS